MDIIENNKNLIAPFTGNIDPATNQYYHVDENGVCDWYQLDDLKFHKSWSWLMPVIAKINGLAIDDKNIQAYFSSAGYIWWAYGDIYVCGNVEDVCKVAVKFIKWHNAEQWICTDPDNDQYGRQINETTFEFKEGDVQAVIDITKYSDEKKQDILNGYGYKLSEQDNWIIAECIFEIEETDKY